jgi:hypothetical protein
LDYKRLWRRAFLYDPNDESEEYDGSAMHPMFMFDDADAFGVAQDDSVEDVAPVGTVPSFVLNVLRRCPDQLDGISEGPWHSHDAATAAAEDSSLANRQILLLMIADKEACEEGWVLEVAINHRGQVLPGRVRTKAGHTREEAGQWLTEGVALNESTLGEDKEIYLQDGDGWDSD